MNKYDLSVLTKFLNQTEEDVEAARSRIYAFSSSTDRAEQLLDEINKLPNKLAFGLFHSVWPDCDNVYPYSEEFLEFLDSSAYEVDFKDYFTPDDRAWFDELPERFRVYRGCDASRSAGFSWTTSREVALGFARGHRGIQYPNPVVISGMIHKRAVYMATNDRSEFEILVGFGNVREKRVTSFPGFR